MGTLIDLLSSTIFGGVLLVIILNANEIAAENHSKYHGDELVQEMLVSTARLIEGEFRNMGYGVPDTLTTVKYADTSRISFLCDLGRDGGFIDTVKYRIGTISELLTTKNELDRYLYRKVNTETELKVGVVTIFNLNYMTLSGDTLPSPVPSDRLSEIYVVEVTMEVQNPFAISRQAAMIRPGERDALYSSSLWQQTRLASQNSRR
ncbi:MAG: hypothetical protein HW412_179 [Bacteroidetes bacterium]|jgi:hypothetical protein|nr:hypothetical protein [Bacteroidota bacterium]